MNETRPPTYSSQVLDRAVQLLGCFTSDQPELRLMELVTRTGLHKSTVFRIIEALRRHDLVEFDATKRSYHLGLRLFELGALATGRLDVSKAAQPALEWLVEQTGETAHLCVLDDLDVVYIAKEESPQQLRMPSSVGHRNPAHCTGVGKAILAFLPEAQLEARLRRLQFRRSTVNTLMSRDALRRDLHSVRNRGYSLDCGEIDEHVRCIGAPVRDRNGDVVAGISIAGPLFRITEANVPPLATLVMEAARRISTALGHRPTFHPSAGLKSR